MLDENIFKSLKQTDIGKNRSKTKERVRKIWMSIKKPQREAILNLADLKRYTVERTYKNGNISAKLAAAMAQTIGIDPYYLIGSTDKQQEYSDELLIQFIESCGYSYLIKPARGKKKALNTTIPAQNEVLEQEELEQEEELGQDDALELDEELVQDDELEQNEIDELEQMQELEHMQTVKVNTQLPLQFVNAYNKLVSLTDIEKANLDNMTEDEIILLVKGLLLRARYGEDAKNLTNYVKLLMTI